MTINLNWKYNTTAELSEIGIHPIDRLNNFTTFHKHVQRHPLNRATDNPIITSDFEMHGNIPFTVQPFQEDMTVDPVKNGIANSCVGIARNARTGKGIAAAVSVTPDGSRVIREDTGQVWVSWVKTSVYVVSELQVELRNRTIPRGIVDFQDIN